MSYLIKTHWPFLLRLCNLSGCIGQIGHFNQVDWSKNTCFKPLVKMDISMNIKKLINQLELFEKPRILIVRILQLLLLFNFG